MPRVLRLPRQLQDPLQRVEARRQYLGALVDLEVLPNSVVQRLQSVGRGPEKVGNGERKLRELDRRAEVERAVLVFWRVLFFKIIVSDESGTFPSGQDSKKGPKKLLTVPSAARSSCATARPCPSPKAAAGSPWSTSPAPGSAPRTASASCSARARAR